MNIPQMFLLIRKFVSLANDYTFGNDVIILRLQSKSLHCIEKTFFSIYVKQKKNPEIKS